MLLLYFTKIKQVEVTEVCFQLLICVLNLTGNVAAISNPVQQSFLTVLFSRIVLFG